jgi:hypothetical protein
MSYKVQVERDNRKLLKKPSNEIHKGIFSCYEPSYGIYPYIFLIFKGLGHQQACPSPYKYQNWSGLSYQIDSLSRSKGIRSID